jgi:hypothetical protein
MKQARDIYDNFIMKELLARSHVSDFFPLLMAYAVRFFRCGSCVRFEAMMVCRLSGVGADLDTSDVAIG